MLRIELVLICSDLRLIQLLLTYSVSGFFFAYLDEFIEIFGVHLELWLLKSLALCEVHFKHFGQPTSLVPACPSIGKPLAYLL